MEGLRSLVRLEVQKEDSRTRRKRGQRKAAPQVRIENKKSQEAPQPKKPMEMWVDDTVITASVQTKLPVSEVVGKM